MLAYIMQIKYVKHVECGRLEHSMWEKAQFKGRGRGMHPPNTIVQKYICTCNNLRSVCMTYMKYVPPFEVYKLSGPRIRFCVV